MCQVAMLFAVQLTTLITSLRSPLGAVMCSGTTGKIPILMGHLLLIAFTAASATLHATNHMLNQKTD